MSLRIEETDLLDADVRVFNIRNLKRVDAFIVLLTLVLAFVGVLTQYSASYGASSVLGTETEKSTFSQIFWKLFTGYSGKQIGFLGIGVLCAVVVACLDYRFLVAIGPVVYIVIVAMLVLTLFSPLGYAVRGARRWLDLGLIRIQPSEFSKLGLIFMLAWYGSRVGPKLQKLGYLLFAFVLVAIPCGLIFLQPSLSTAVALLPAALIMLYIAGCRLLHFFLLGLLVLFPATVVINQALDYEEIGPEAYNAKHYPLGIKLKETQVQRILTFILPNPDPKKTGYHALQARITVGSGQLAGKGFLKGTQTHLSFLPDFHTDFIFALLAEEWGFVGATAVIVLFLLFFQRGLSLAFSCPDPAGRLLGVGCASLLAFHAFTNMAVTVGLLPVTGMPLPFLSYGGSFYITTCLCVGCLLSIQVRKRFFQ
ncbi:MAG TPA: rod shape-determining protein RodA [Candidatus Hydrogenedentes bacterium]|nr:rod shape-determining protein RodA [Candidatus Hydrogenedentota bacterium]HOL76899.1 rod shape-determining protein RodA [Candidatus Hydrogenedentota bacterium]HPO85552.1 rod shape-determining protein RodA [Candidatus Hydrogenedentota bacterium]